MAGLDTNILVRWLMDDDVRQSASVAALLSSVRSNADTLFVPTTVALELEWVLRARYGLDKPTVVSAFNALLDTQELEFEHEALLEQALDAYKHGAADFADCLHASACRAAGRAPLMTFDRGAAKFPGAQLLST